jgi:hypothetical protein
MRRIRSFTIPDGMTFEAFKLVLYARRTHRRHIDNLRRYDIFERRYPRVLRFVEAKEARANS